MALIVADRVLETSTTTGTGAFTLSGAKTGFRPFSAVLSVNDTTYYTIHNAMGNGAEWEVGLGTYLIGGILQRTTILASSNSNAAVNFTAGIKDVFITAAATMLPVVQVRSFNGRTGAVTPQQSDYDSFFTTTAEAAAAAPVQSVAGRTGAVTLAAGDISGLAASATTDTTNASNISSGTLPAARLPTTGVTANSYGSSTAVGSFTVAADGRLSAASSTSIAFPVTSVFGRTGAVTAQQSDYDSFFTTPSEAAAAAPVQSVSAGSGISVNSTTGAVTVTNSDTGSSAVSSHVANSDPHTQYPRLYTATVNTSANTALTVTHNLGLSNKDAFVIRIANSSGQSVQARVTSTSVNALTILTVNAETSLVVTVVG